MHKKFVKIILFLYCFVLFCAPVGAWADDVEEVKEFDDIDYAGEYWSSQGYTMQVSEDGVLYGVKEGVMPGGLIEDKDSRFRGYKLRTYSGFSNTPYILSLGTSGDVSTTITLSTSSFTNYPASSTRTDSWLNAAKLYTYGCTWIAETAEGSEIQEGEKVKLNIDFSPTLLLNNSRAIGPRSYGETFTIANYYSGLVSFTSPAIPPTSGSANPVATPLITITAQYTDGTTEDLATSASISYSGTVKVKKECSAIAVDLQISQTPNLSYSGDYNYYSIYPQFKADISGSITLDDSGVTDGLLKSIIQWLQNILNAITALPGEIVSGIKDGLIYLFVPNAEDLSGMFDDFKSSIEGKAGVLGQIAVWVSDLFESLISATINAQSSITIPRLAIPWKAGLPTFGQLAGGELVIWEEMTWQVIPDGMDDLKDMLQTFTSIWAVVCLIMCAYDSYHRLIGYAFGEPTYAERQRINEQVEQIVNGRSMKK